MGVRDWQDAEYSRIYHTIPDDEKFDEVYYDDRRWAAYTRLLMAAEATYPAPTPLPRWLADDVLEHLVEVRILEVVRGTAYRIVGMKAEREGRAKGRQVGGKVRATTAERDELGHFLPRSEESSNSSSNGDAGDPATPSNTQQQSQQLTSKHIAGDQHAQLSRAEIQPSRERDSQTRESARPRATQRQDIAALRDLGWKRISKDQRRVLAEIADRHRRPGDDGSWFAAEAIAAASGTDPLRAAIDADRMWQESQRRRVRAEEQSAAEAKAQEAEEAKPFAVDPPDWYKPLKGFGDQKKTAS